MQWKLFIGKHCKNCYILYTSNHYRWKTGSHTSIMNTTLTWMVILKMDSCNSCCVCAYIIPIVIVLVYTYVYAQSMDLCDLWVVLHIVVINTLQNTLFIYCPLPNYNSWIVHSVPCEKYGLSREGFVVLRTCKLSYLAIYNYVSNIIATFKNACEYVPWQTI